MIINLKKLHKDAVVPTRATELAGGWDVVATEIIQEADDFVICKLGFALDIPEGYKLTLVPRSSITKTKWVMQNSPGLGDSDFINEYQIRFRALPCGFINPLGSAKFQEGLIYPEFPYKVGDRIGQVYLEEVISIEFNIVDEIKESNRLGGYGSTGK